DGSNHRVDGQLLGLGDGYADASSHRHDFGESYQRDSGPGCATTVHREREQCLAGHLVVESSGGNTLSLGPVYCSGFHYQPADGTSDRDCGIRLGHGDDYSQSAATASSATDRDAHNQSDFDNDGAGRLPAFHRVGYGCPERRDMVDESAARLVV